MTDSVVPAVEAGVSAKHRVSSGVHEAQLRC